MVWGAHLDQSVYARTWTAAESPLHINWLDLQVVFKALQSLESGVTNRYVLMTTEDYTAVSYINFQRGTHSASLCLAN